MGITHFRQFAHHGHASTVQSSTRPPRWNQQELARQAGVGIVTVHQLETGLTQPRRATLEVIRRALESAGVEFTNGDQPGVRLTKAAAAHSPKPVSGPKPTVAAKVGRSKTAKATEKKNR